MEEFMAKMGNILAEKRGVTAFRQDIGLEREVLDRLLVDDDSDDVLERSLKRTFAVMQARRYQEPKKTSRHATSQQLRPAFGRFRGRGVCTKPRVGTI